MNSIINLYFFNATKAQINTTYLDIKMDILQRPSVKQNGQIWSILGMNFKMPKL